MELFESIKSKFSFIAPSIYEVGRKHKIKDMQSLILLSRIYSFNKRGQACYESQDTLKNFIMKDSRHTVRRKNMFSKIAGILTITRRKVFPSTNEYHITEKTLSMMIAYDEKMTKKNNNQSEEIVTHSLENNVIPKTSKKNYMISWENYCSTSDIELIKNYEGVMKQISICTEKAKEYEFLKKADVLEAISYTENCLIKIKGKNITNHYRWFRTTLLNRINKSIKSEKNKKIFEILIYWGERDIFFGGSEFAFETNKKYYLSNHPEEEPPNLEE